MNLRWPSVGVGLTVLAVQAMFSCTVLAKPLFRLGTAAGVAGEASLTLPLEILPEANAFVAGWSAVVSYDPAVMTALGVENTRRADLFGFRTYATHATPGVLWIWVVYSLGSDTNRMLSSSSGGVVANLSFCILEGAPTGTFPVAFLTESPTDHHYQTLATFFEGTFETSFPIVEAGAVSISRAGIPSGGGCESELPNPPSPPPVFKGTFKLRDETAVRGLPVTIPFIINGEEDVSGFSFSIDFDEEVLQAVSVRPVYEGLFDNAEEGRQEYQHFEWNNSNDVPGNSGVGEGFITGAVVFDLTSWNYFLPKGEDNEVLKLHFLVNPKAPLGPTEVRFEDGGRFLSFTQKNMLRAAGSAAYPDFVPATVLVNARLNIIGEVSAFVRGDSNIDGKVDIGDAVRTFMFLFLGAEAPGCLDAADATDDGTVDISDGIRILNYFFGPGAEIPPPGPRECGLDPVTDGLGCKSYPRC